MEKNNNISFIIIVSIILFSIKWIYSFIYFPGEEITLRIISEAISDSYFHYVKVLSELNFNNDYYLKQNEYLLLVPIGSVIFHSILYKIIGIFSFIFFEFISIFLFIYIFTSIFSKFNFKNNISIFLSLILFSLPLIIFIKSDFIYLNNFISIFYNLKFPRPLVTNIYLFFFLYFAISNFNKELFSKKNIYILGFFFSLLLSSSFYIFLPLSLFLIIYFFIKKENQDFLIKISKFKLHLIASFLICLFFILLFLFLIKNSNPDYSSRMGLIDLTIENKLFLLKYFFKNVLFDNLVFLILLPFVFYLIIKKYLNNKYTYIVDIFIINYICSILGFFLLILISNKIAFINHINNFIIINLFLFFFVIIIYFYKILLIKFNFNPLNKNIVNLLIIFLILLNVLSPINLMNNNKEITKIRSDKINLINMINKIDKSCSILTFDNSIMTFLILKNFKNIPYINGSFVNRDDEILENNLINSLKILNLNRDELKYFMKSKWDGWRLKNSNMQQLFWQKYQANSFYTIDGSMDFEEYEIKIIKKSPPSKIHQIAIPNYEKKRLLEKFDNYNDIKFHDFIIIDRNDKFWSDEKFKKNKYEVFLENENFKLYKKITLPKCLKN